MAFIETIPPDAAEGPVRAMYSRQQAHYGYVPNYAKVFCQRPEVLARWAQLLAEIRRSIAPREFELVTLVAAHALNNTACSLAHGKALLAYFSEEEVAAIVSHPEPGCLNAAERALVNFSRQVALDASAITAADVQALREQGFSDAQVFDIAATAAGRAFFTKLLDALGVLPEAADNPFSPDLLSHLLVGRRPDTAPVECLPPE